MLSNSSENVFWLYGIAGSGKSTVSTTIAEYFRGIPHLGSFLFFERDKSEPTAVVRTIGYKLASVDSAVAKHVVASATQFEKLLLEPLNAAAATMQGPILVVFDALDECGMAKARCDLMQLFRQNFWLLITNQPEKDVSNALSSKPNFVRAIGLDCASVVSREDVLHYTNHEMQRVVSEWMNVPRDWPWAKNTSFLDAAAAGLFIWHRRL